MNGRKKLRRAFPDGNEAIVSVDEDLCSSMTATEACAQASITPYITLIVATFLHVELYLRHGIFESNISDGDIFAALIHHAQLGV